SESARQAALAFVTGLRAAQMEEFLLNLAPKRMRILLGQNSPYFPAQGGGDKSNRLLLEALAERGHVCRVIARTGTFGPQEHARYLGELASRSVSPASTSDGVVVFFLHGVEVHVLTHPSHPRRYFTEQLSAFSPDVVI